MSEPTNKERAARIPPTLLAYEVAKGDGNGEPDESTLRDLLADILHYCEDNAVNFDEELRIATNNFEAERRAQGEHKAFGDLEIGTRFFDPMSGEFWVKIADDEGRQDSGGDHASQDAFKADELVILDAA